MLFNKKQPQLSAEQALGLKPMRLVEAEMQRVQGVDDNAGGLLTVKLRQPKWGRRLFRLPEHATKTFEFDSIGTFVWENIDGKTSVEQIIKRLSKRYDLNLREAQVPTLSFLQTLIKKGLVGVPLEKAKKEPV